MGCPTCGTKASQREPLNDEDRAMAAWDDVLLRLPTAPMSFMPAYFAWIVAVILLGLPAAITCFSRGVILPSHALFELPGIVMNKAIFPLATVASFIYLDVGWAVSLFVLGLRGSHYYSMATMGQFLWQPAPVETRHDLMHLSLDSCKAIGWPVYLMCGSVAAFCYFAAIGEFGKFYVVGALIALGIAWPIAWLGSFFGHMWFQYVVCPKELNVAIDRWFQSLDRQSKS